MARIQVLDDTLVDQIAAGEVVERPASVVKELLENALDAGATSIDVEIEDGGKGLIRIVDDGSGMSREDAELCVRRHATSKIRRLEDLGTLASLGFRGEALPSIASVSRFVLTTRMEPAIEATRVRIVGGGAPEVRDAGGPLGTSVEVRDLFYNVPARRKFLKADHTESAHIGTVCQRVALAHPGLRLRLLSQARLRREYLPTMSRAERVRAILGDETLSALRVERQGLGIEAHLSPPERARAGAQQLFLFVNGRPIRDARLARAVSFAYGSVLPPGRYPVGAVYLELDPSEVDVNAHPQKIEVRFRNDRLVLETMTRAIGDALGTTPWERPSSGPSLGRRSPDFWGERLGGAASTSEPRTPRSALEVERNAKPLFEQLDVFAETRRAYDGAAAPSGAAIAREDARTREPAGAHGGTFAQGHEHKAPGGAESERPYPDPSRAPGAHADRSFGALRALGQVRQLFIVCEGPDALYFVDQHAADERVRFHRLRAAYRERGVRAQRLLFPERVELSADEALAVETHGEALERLGLEVHRIGETLAVVHTVPELVARAPADRLLRDALDELTLSGDRHFGDAIDTVLATMACHGAIRAGDPLAPEECAALLRNLDTVDEHAGHCPHGRPVVFKVPFAEVERRLGR